MYAEFCMTQETLSNNITVPFNFNGFTTFSFDVSMPDGVKWVRNIRDINVAPMFDGTAWFHTETKDYNLTTVKETISFPAGVDIVTGTATITQKVWGYSAPPIPASPTAAIIVNRAGMNFSQQIVTYLVNFTANRTNNTINFNLTGNIAGINTPVLINVHTI
jgi:hypothetical protein